MSQYLFSYHWTFSSCKFHRQLHFSAAGCSLHVLTSLSSLALICKISFSVLLAYRTQSNRHFCNMSTSQTLHKYSQRGRRSVLPTLSPHHIYQAFASMLCGCTWGVRHSFFPCLVWSCDLNPHFLWGGCTAFWGRCCWSLQLKLFCFLYKMFGLCHRIIEKWLFTKLLPT